MHFHMKGNVVTGLALCITFFIPYLFFTKCDCVVLPNTGNEQQRIWNKLGADEINEALKRRQINYKAKNVIMFLGDGMGISTLTASRILKGQMKGNPGEEEYLVFERFPNVALVKTYNVDHQVPDSAGTATAYLSGVKANSLTVGVDENVKFANCSSYDESYNTISALTHALKAGKEAGIISTATITHGTPAAAYAHTPNRFWSNDAVRNNEVPQDLRSHCPDVASQFVANALDYKVIFSGGRRDFHNSTVPDVEYPDQKGKRSDGRDLINEWMEAQKAKNRKPNYVWNKKQFDNISETSDEYILGLFNPSYMSYQLERNKDVGGEPDLADMTKKAIKILSQSSKGYFLFVEGARIDMAHHAGMAKKALTETLDMELAVEAALTMTKEEDTLIIVTADHSHTMSITGYATRGNDILGLADNQASNYFNPENQDKAKITLGPDLADDKLPYTTLIYANGPGAVPNEYRRNISSVDTKDNDFRQPALIPFSDETHAGEDVAVYARGPMAHLFHRCHEQNYVAHVMMYAACVGDYSGNKCNLIESNSHILVMSPVTLIVTFVISLKINY